MENQNNHRNKKKLSKISNTIDFELLQDELRQNNRHYKPNRKPNKRNRAGKK